MKPSPDQKRGLHVFPYSIWKLREKSEFAMIHWITALNITRERRYISLHVFTNCVMKDKFEFAVPLRFSFVSYFSTE